MNKVGSTNTLASPVLLPDGHARKKLPRCSHSAVVVGLTMTAMTLSHTSAASKSDRKPSHTRKAGIGQICQTIDAVPLMRALVRSGQE